MAKGLFVVLEGIDGAGTTTQSRLLVEWLERRGAQAVRTAEPTHGPIGTLIRDILQGRRAYTRAGQSVPVDEVTMALLFAADRSDHLQATILPALDAGHVAVSDRHYLSSVAYQSLGVEADWVQQLNSRFPRPDLTILLDVEPERSLRRKLAGNQQAERYEKVATLERVRENYLQAVAHARAAGERVEVLDGAPSIEAVHERICELVAPLLVSREGAHP